MVGSGLVRGVVDDGIGMVVLHKSHQRTHVHLVDEEGGHDEEARPAEDEGEEAEQRGVHGGVVRHCLLFDV